MKLIFDSKMKEVALFVATSFLIYIAWYIVHDFYLLPKTNFINNLINFETKLSVLVLNLLPTNDIYTAKNASIICNNVRTLRIGEECNGLTLFVLFAGFIMAFPGTLKSKILFIPIGVTIIFIVNILRIVVLAINYKYFRASFSFNHHVTFTYLVYAIIFLMWIYWVNKLSKKTIY